MVCELLQNKQKATQLLSATNPKIFFHINKLFYCPDYFGFWFSIFPSGVVPFQSKEVERSFGPWMTIQKKGSRMLCDVISGFHSSTQNKNQKQTNNGKNQKQRRSEVSSSKNINTKIVLHANSITLLVWPGPSQHRTTEQTNTMAFQVGHRVHFSETKFLYKYDPVQISLIFNLQH